MDDHEDGDHSEPIFSRSSKARLAAVKVLRKKANPIPYEEYLVKHMSSEAAACQIFCSVCAGNTSAVNNRIVMCDLCDSPYHQLCHITPIDNDLAEEY